MANATLDCTSTSLIQIYGENVNKKFDLNGSTVLIGRNLKSDIKLECPNVSRKHCILIKSEKGWIIKDNKSQNGTYINGRKLKPDESHVLECGDIIFLGPPSEMPQAFCCEVNYKLEETEPRDKPETMEKIVLSPEKSDSERSSLGVMTQVHERKNCRKKFLVVKKNSIDNKPTCSVEVVISPLSSPEKISCNVISSKEVTHKKNPLGEKSDLKANNEKREVPKNIKCLDYTSKSRKDNHGLKCPVDIQHKRKISTSQQISCSPSDERKKTKRTAALTLASESNESLDNNQINEISSTDDNQVEDSLSLLDVHCDDGSNAFFNTSEMNRPGCSHDAYSSVDSQKAETEVLKSKLASMSAEIKKLKKAKFLILKNYKDVSEKNKTLDEQLAEQERLKEELQNCELRVKNEMKKELLEKFEEDLICNICTELLIKPTVLDCAHTFCEFCIKEWKKKKNECPMCRKKIENMTRVLTLDNFIEKTVQTLTPDQRDKRDELIKQRQETEMNQQKVPRPSPRGNARRRRMITRVNRRHREAVRDSVEIIGERNVLLPISLPSLPFPIFLNNANLRAPDLLFSDNAMDTLNIYVS